MQIISNTDTKHSNYDILNEFKDDLEIYIRISEILKEIIKRPSLAIEQFNFLPLLNR